MTRPSEKYVCNCLFCHYAISILTNKEPVCIHSLLSAGSAKTRGSGIRGGILTFVCPVSNYVAYYAILEGNYLSSLFFNDLLFNLTYKSMVELVFNAEQLQSLVCGLLS